MLLFIPKFSQFSEHLFALIMNTFQITFFRFAIAFVSTFALHPSSNLAQGTESQIRHLLGKCTVADFKQAPFNAWYEQGFASYTPNASILQPLKQTNLTTPVSRLRFKVFLGTWCGDSQREFPRFMKLLSVLGVPESAVEIIAVNNADSAHKRSPTGEERNMDIFRVPTVLIFDAKKGREQEEIARVVEYPAESWERDMVRILRGEEYRSSYHTYPILREWLKSGLLADTNIVVSGLASRLRHLVTSEGEINACAFVLLSCGQVQQAVTLYRVNAAIFPQSARVLEALAEGYEKQGKLPNAIRALERALELDTKNTSVLNMLVRLKAKAL